MAHQTNLAPVMIAFGIASLLVVGGATLWLVSNGPSEDASDEADPVYVDATRIAHRAHVGLMLYARSHDGRFPVHGTEPLWELSSGLHTPLAEELRIAAINATTPFDFYVDSTGAVIAIANLVDPRLSAEHAAIVVAPDGSVEHATRNHP